MSDYLLELSHLTKEFRIGGLMWGTRIKAVDDVNLRLEKARPSILSIVGESGSGKTTLARIILKLHEPTTGEVRINGEDIFSAQSSMKGKNFYRLVQPIFQNPFETFSMRKTVDTYLYQTALKLGIAKNRREAEGVIANVLSSVGLDIRAVANKYPHQFSGGELQRVSVARGLIPQPKLLVADEPVSMLDASLRMNVVNLFLELKEQYNVSLVYITHDLSTAYYVSDYIAIMYRGNVVEYGPSEEILTHAEHPYTQLLLDSVPTVGKKWQREPQSPALEISEYQAGACKFADRCRYVEPICRQTMPAPVQLSATRSVLCYKPVDYQPGVTTVKTAPSVSSEVG